MERILMYKLGSLEQFKSEDAAVKKAAGWTEEEVNSGKIIASEDKGGNSLITNLIIKKTNPDGSDEHLWESGEGTIKDPFNILSIWNRKIKEPIPPKYYIATRSACSILSKESGECYIYGKVSSNQELKFGSKVVSIEIFDTEAEYLAKIEELGIKLDEDDL